MAVSRPGRLLLALLAAVVLGASVAAGTPAQVIRDYQRDGQLDHNHSAADLRAAAASVHGTPIAAALNQAIEDRLFVELAGISQPPPSPPPAPGAAARGADGVASSTSLTGLASAPAQRPAGGLPVAVLVLGALAAALVLSGLTAAITRRLIDRTLRPAGPR